MSKLVKPAILSISLLIIMTNNTISPALSEISSAFPNAGSNLVKLVLTLPSFVIIPFSSISGRISSTVKNQKIIIIGLIVYFLGGISGGFSRNIYELLFTRALLGAGMGLLMPFATSLIADFYKGTERTVMMGLSNAVANFGGIIATLASGTLAIYNWRYIFIAYSIAIPVLILVTLGLPEPPNKDKTSNKSLSLNNRIIFIAILAFFLNIAFYAVIINIALFIKSEGIGNSGYSGIATSFVTFAGFISGICLRQISKIFKRFRVPFAISFMSLGFLLLSTSHNLTLVLISNFLVGFGLGILKPVLFLNVADASSSHSNAFAISIVSNSILFGKFVSPLFLDLWGKIFRNNSIRFTFLSMGILLSCAAIISLLIMIQPKKIFKPKY
ncbi:MFS transporter [Wukongibacter sp. M2B1]|uniref:MFS transporter n=1 Tax=Wukongibacter sp. M2B1 TaxID=3088895 RepID=UPI003D7BB21E